MPIPKQEEMLSCEECIHLETLFGYNWTDGYCHARGKAFNGLPMVERVFDARASQGNCGPERKNYTRKPK